MIKPATAMALAAADMNDSAQVNYTMEALLPYFNMAVEELFQRMEENNIPITNQTTSPFITVTAGLTEIPFYSTTQTVLLPPDLVEPTAIWESNDTGTTWTPMGKVDKINPNIQFNQNLSSFGTYEWLGDRIKVPQASGDIIIQIDYIRRLIKIPLVIEQIALPIQTDAILFLAHKTAALCAALVAQNETRAQELQELSEQAIEREMNIPTKGRQNIATRRKPFRLAFKSWRRGGW